VIGEIDLRINFFSVIGGLLGLCIGMSIVTFVELFWLLLKMGGIVVNKPRPGSD
jgi:hypothetical protein